MVVGKCPAEQEEQVIEAEVNMSLGLGIRGVETVIVIGPGQIVTSFIIYRFVPAVVCSYTCLMFFFKLFPVQDYDVYS